MSDIAVANTGSFSYTNLFLKNGNVRTDNDTFLTGQTLAQNQVIARLSANGKLVAHNPGASDGSQNAVGITCDVVNTTAGDASHSFYYSGDFNIDALVWHASLTTTAAKKAVFVDKPIKVGLLSPA